MQEEIDYIICRLCNKKFQVLASHVKKVHNISVEKYKERFPNSLTVCKKLSVKLGHRKVFIDKNWLYEKYVMEGYHGVEIAKMLGIRQNIVTNRLREYGWSQYRRTDLARKDKHSKAWWYQKYYVEELTPGEIAKLLNCRYGSVYVHLKRLGFKMRTRVEASELGVKKGKYKQALVKKRKNKNPFYYDINLSREAIHFLDGELLGDGRIHSSGCFVCKSKHRVRLEELSKKLGLYSVKQRDNIKKGVVSGKVFKNVVKNPDKFKNKYYVFYSYRSLNYECLKKQKQRWYLQDFSFCPNCSILFCIEACNKKEWLDNLHCPVCQKHMLLRKVVPKDIELTPETCCRWYIGDGHLDGGHGITIATKSFLDSDLEFLKQKLEELGFVVRIKNRVISFDIRESREFLSYIGACPVDCYQYKWDEYHLSKPDSDKTIYVYNFNDKINNDNFLKENCVIENYKNKSHTYRIKYKNNIVGFVGERKYGIVGKDKKGVMMLKITNQHELRVFVNFIKESIEKCISKE